MTPPATEAQERFHRLRMGLLSKGGKVEPAREERPQTPSEPNHAQERFHRLLMGVQGAPPEKEETQQKPPERHNEPEQAQKFSYRSRIGARRKKEWSRPDGAFHLSWLYDAGVILSLDEAGQVAWTIREGFQKIWDLGPGERLVNHAWQCWQYAKAHRREILAALKPCAGWIPTRPIREGESLEELIQALELERQRGEITVCPFLQMWIAVKDCPRWCGRWADPLTEEEKKFWAVLWPDGKWPDGKQDAA